MSWSFWWLAQLVWDDQTVESHNLLEWVTKVDLVNKNEESSLRNNLIWNMKDDEDMRPCSNCILEVLQMNLKIDTIECYGIRLLRAIQATPRIIRACPESIMSHTFWSCVVVTPDGHLDWGGSWPGRSLRDSGKPIPGKQIQNFPSTPIGVKLLCSIIHCHRSDPEHLTMQIDWKRKVLDHPLVPI